MWNKIKLAYQYTIICSVIVLIGKGWMEVGKALVDLQTERKALKKFK